MYIPIDFGFWDIAYFIPFLWGFPGWGREPSPRDTATTGIPSFSGGAQYPPGQQVENLIRRAQQLASAGDYQGAFAVETEIENYVTQISPTLSSTYGRNAANVQADVSGARERGRSWFGSVRGIYAAQQEALTKQSTQQQTLESQTLDASTKAILQALQPTPVASQIEALTLSQLQKESAALEAPTRAPQAQINPEIAADIYNNISASINRETEDARKVIMNDLSQRGLLGSGIEQQVMTELQKRKEERLTEAQQYSSVKSAELGISQGGLDVQRELARQAASQFNIGIGAELEKVGQRRALETFSTLSGGRESALNRSLAAAQLRQTGEQGRREADLTQFEILSRNMEEQKKRRQSMLQSIFAPIGGVATAIGTGFGLKKLGVLKEIFGKN